MTNFKFHIFFVCFST